MKINTKWLERKKACRKGIKWFSEKYGAKSADAVSVLAELAGDNAWRKWLIIEAKLSSVIEWDDRRKDYYERGKLHRAGGLPAVEWANGRMEYYERGKLHRAGGLPAVEWANGRMEYYERGKLHWAGGLP